MTDEPKHLPIRKGEAAYVVAFETLGCTVCFVGPEIDPVDFGQLAQKAMCDAAWSVRKLPLDTACAAAGRHFYGAMLRRGYECPDPVVLIEIRAAILLAKDMAAKEVQK